MSHPRRRAIELVTHRNSTSLLPVVALLRFHVRVVHASLLTPKNLGIQHSKF
jgi:hypothetical protein